MNRHAAEYTLSERCHNLVVVLDFGAYESAQGSAVLFVDDYVVGHVDQTAGKITGVGGLERGVGKTLAGTVGRDEVFEHAQTFLEVGENRVLDDLTAFCAALLGLGHKTAHTGKLTDLIL